MKDPIHTAFAHFVRHRDERSFKKIFDHFYPRLFQFAVRFVQQPVLAEEVVSEVFYKLLKDRKAMGNIRNITYYLFKAVKNQSYTALRTQRRDRIIEPLVHEEDYIIPASTNPEKRYLHSEIQELLENAVCSLPAQRQMIFRMVRQEGLKNREVADILDISPRTVETHLGLAVKDLCAALKEHLHRSSPAMLPKAGRTLSVLLAVATMTFV